MQSMQNLAIDYRECLLALDPPRRRWQAWRRLGRRLAIPRRWLVGLGR